MAAIIFLQQRNTQKSLILAFVVVTAITAMVIWQGFLKGEEGVFVDETFAPSSQEIKINFDTLKSPALEILQPFSEIKPLKEVAPVEGGAIEKPGRENPFIPY